MLAIGLRATRDNSVVNGLLCGWDACAAAHAVAVVSLGPHGRVSYLLLLLDLRTKLSYQSLQLANFRISLLFLFIFLLDLSHFNDLLFQLGDQSVLCLHVSLEGRKISLCRLVSPS